MIKFYVLLPLLSLATLLPWESEGKEGRESENGGSGGGEVVVDW